MLSTSPNSFRFHYQALVSSGAIEADSAQADAVAALAVLDERLVDFMQDGGLHRCFPFMCLCS